MRRGVKCPDRDSCPNYKRESSYGVEIIRCENTKCPLFKVWEAGEHAEEKAMDSYFEVYDNPIDRAKACPFCATKHLVPRLRFDKSDRPPVIPHGTLVIECRICGARGPEAKGRIVPDIFTKAVDLWNTRDTFRIGELQEGDEEV